MAAKKTLADITGPRYRKAGKAGKSVMLDEFCATTGYNRKYAITLLRHAGKTQLRRVGKETVNVKITAQSRQKRVYQRFYDTTVERAVLDIWEFFHRVCGTRLVPMIRANLSALAARFIISTETQAKLAKVSRSTVERMLRRERKRHKAKGTSATKPGTLLKQQIPVRTFWRWDDKKPGFCEIDTVSHDGGFAHGEYAFTLSLTDVATCWSEFRALKNKAQSWTLKALQHIRDGFPVPLKGLDSDNGSEFINWHLKDWCEANRIAFTRGRQRHKNDNAYVEQKNGDVVRKTIGYGRIAGDQALAALEAVYAVLNPLYNFFYPNLKCIDKRQVGHSKRRVYEREPKTPFQRILELPDAEVSFVFKQRLVAQKNSLDVIALQEQLDRALARLDRFVHRGSGVVTRRESLGLILP
jgi:hypothetical protein